MKNYDQHCGLALALERVGERWSLLVVRELLTGPKRFSELRKMLPGIAPNLLVSRLGDLTRGEIVREGYGPGGAKSYQLTELGWTLEEPVLALIQWGGRFVSGSRGRLHSPHWLPLEIKGLLRGRELKRKLAGHFLIEGFGFRLEVSSDGGLSLGPGMAGPADFRVETDYRTCLALFSGELALKDAGKKLSLTGDRSAFASLL